MVLRLTALLLGCLFFIPARATTIVPFPSAGDMLDASALTIYGTVTGTYQERNGNTVVYGLEVEATELVKGRLITSTVRVRTHSVSTTLTGEVTKIDYGIALAEGQSYLLFLREVDSDYLPLTLHLGVYESKTGTDDLRYLVPMRGAALLLSHPSGRRVEPQRIYAHDNLLTALRSRLADATYFVEAMATELTLRDFPRINNKLPPPSQCNSFTTTFQNTRPELPLRWPNTDITIFHNATNPSVGTTNAHALVQTMVASLNANYRGLNLSYGGVTTIGGNQCFNDAVQAGPSQSITISFQDTDICGETGLAGCSGTLGQGGPSFSSATNTDSNGDEYYSIVSGGVIIDEGAGCTGTTGFVRLLEHEVTHALGFDHITSVVANMNEDCCIAINENDIECLDYVYAPLRLPVELVAFSARPAGKIARLEWETATEVNSADFVVQHSTDGARFATVGRLAAAGNSVVTQRYGFDHTAPASGQNYYRLLQRDLDGSTTLSEVRPVSFDEPFAGGVFPNPATHQLTYRHGTLAAGTEVEIIGSNGALLRRLRVADGAAATLLSVADLPAGLYQLRAGERVERFVIR